LDPNYLAPDGEDFVDGMIHESKIRWNERAKKSRKRKNDGDEKNKSTCECGGKYVKIENVFVYRPDEVRDRIIEGEPVCNKCGKVEGKRKEEEVTEVYGERPERRDFGLGSERQLKTEIFQFDTEEDVARKQIASWANLEEYSENFLVKDTLKIFKECRYLGQGRGFKQLTAACFYFVCRKNKIPITAGSFFEGYCKEKNMTDMFYLICSHLEEKPPLDKARNKIRYVGKKVFMPEVLLRKATELIDKIPDSTSGPNPTGIAAAALFLVSKDSEYAVTQKKLAEAVGIHKLTIGKSVKIVEKYWKND